MKKCILFAFQLVASILFAQFALAQGNETDRSVSGFITENLVENHQVFYFFPGGGYYGRHSPNTFTYTFCCYMEALLENEFVVVTEPISRITAGNVVWALWYGQKPLSQPQKNKKARLAFERIMSEPHPKNGQIIIISSSYGTTLAAQTAIAVADYYRQAGLEPPKINLFFGASMISKKSKLFRKLEELRAEGVIGLIVYDELQDVGDNVTGMCGNSKLGAFLKAFEMAWVFVENYQGQPSILNNHPYHGHIHHQRAQSIDKGKEFVSVILIDYEMSGPKIRERATEVVSQRE